MAEMALGMTKTLVEGALGRMQAAIEEEKKLKEGVPQDLAFITGEFEMMQSFLKVANRERARKNEVARTWVRQLRDLAFDVENWVEFVVHMDTPKSGAWSNLCRAAPSWAVPRCLAPPRHLDEAAAEMKLLKARVEDLSHRNTRYNLFSTDDGSAPGSGSGLDDSKKATTAASINNWSHRAFEVLGQMWANELGKLRMVEGGSCAGTLKSLLIAPDAVPDGDLQVIWLWGGHDRDISSNINTVYHDPETSKWFDHRAWAKIRRPFKQEELRKTLQDQLGLTNSTSLTSNDTQCSMQPEMNDEKRYLVVVEHVSDFEEWNTIRMCLPDMTNNKGSRIVVSTQHLLLPVINYAGSTSFLVTELIGYLDGRPTLCAFYKKVPDCFADEVAQLREKMKLGTIISVCGDGQRKSRLVKSLYKRVMFNGGDLGGGVKFGYQRWVPVVGGQQEALNLLDLSRRMVLNLGYCGFYDGDLHDLLNIFCGANAYWEVVHVWSEQDVIKAVREYVMNNNSLVVIDGLRSTKDWDVIKSNFLLPEIRSHCCFVVVTGDEDVARYCVDGNEEQLVRVRTSDGTSQGRMLPDKREAAIGQLTSIYDRCDPYYQTSNQRQDLYDSIIVNCMPREMDPQRVLSVFGMAGVGKSAMVKWSYGQKMLHPARAHSSFNNYCWVEVPHPFSLEELSWRLLLGLLSDNAQLMEAAMINIIDERQDIIQECRMWLLNVVGAMGSLIVLDGVRSTEDWDAINAVFCLSQPIYKNYTIVITDDRSVATHCVNHNAHKVVNVWCLEANDALRLFHRLIDYDSMDTSEGKDDVRVSELSKRIMARCGGLPKVIAVVAECYKKSLEKGIYLKLKAINDNFMYILEGAPSLSGMFSWMESYLETCKDEIKPCIFYLPVFRVGQKVRFRRLAQRWSAEGYVRDTSSATAEQNAFWLVVELVNCGIIRQQISSKPVQYQVNGFFHQYITSRPLEDNLCLALEGHCSLNASQRAGPPAQHLTVRSISDTDEAAFRNIDFSRLRSLTVVGKCRRFMFDAEKIKMKYVRVLDLEDAKGVEDDHLENVVEVFPRLKFLSLRGCRDITSLPKSLGGLRQLQALDVRDTSIAKLPEAILELHKLQYVRGGTRLSNPWDEGGSMVVEKDPTTVAADAPSAPAEDAATVAFAAAPATVVTADAPFTPAQDATTVAAALAKVAVDAPPVLAEDATTVAVAADAPSALAEDATTVVVAADAPSAPAEDATTVAVAAAPATVAADALSALVEDATTVAVAAASTTIAADALSAPAEDGTAVAVAAALATIAADAPSTPALSAPAEDTTTIAVAAASLLASAQSPTSSVEAPLLSAAAATRGSPAPAKDSSTATSSRRHALTIPSWLSKLCCRSRIDSNASNPGVEVPAGIGKLTVLQTFGVANVGTGRVILEELPKLNELRRLSVCGVNPDNIRRFFSAISGLPHLSMLSVRLDKNNKGQLACLDDTIERPPKSLVARLKLHGHVRVHASSWIKEFTTVLEVLDLEVTLQREEDMQVILDQLLHHKDVLFKSRLCLKPVYHGNLKVERPRHNELQISILEIFCTTELQATFVRNIPELLEVVKVHCSSESSLQLFGLKEIRCLKQVWLKGSFRDDSLKQDLQRQIKPHTNAPILKVFQPCNVQTPGVRPNRE